MDTTQRRIKSLFGKIVRICKGLLEDTSAGQVHQFRTTMRRIESLLNANDFELTAKDRKLLQQLEVIRKRAGKIRDIDVQLDALNSLGLDRSYDQRKQVQAALERRREKRAAKLVEAAAKFSTGSGKKIKDLAARLSAHVPADAEKKDYMAVAMEQFTQSAGKYLSDDDISPDSLHDFRLALKGVRYTAEIAGKIPAAEALVAQAKQIQDAIGEWHDWENLTKSAEKELDGVRSSALISYLRNMTGAKLSTAMRTAVEVGSRMLSTNTQKMAGAQKKVPGRVTSATSQSRARIQA